MRNKKTFTEKYWEIVFNENKIGFSGIQISFLFTMAYFIMKSNYYFSIFEGSEVLLILPLIIGLTILIPIFIYLIIIVFRGIIKIFTEGSK